MVEDRWKDRLGDRLYHPDRVRVEDRHLIPDDWQRVRVLTRWPAEGRGLEVGCGDGTMTTLLKRAHSLLELTAADVDTWDIATPPPVAITYRGAYDVIYCCEVLEHLTEADAHRALGHFMDLLVPGGHLILSVPNAEPPLHYVAGCRDRWRWPDHRSYWTLRRLLGLLQCQRRAVSIEWQPLYPEDVLAQHSIWLIARARFV